MKKLLTIILIASLTLSTFSFEGFSKKSSTEDGYPIEIQQMDKSEKLHNYEFEVSLLSKDSEERFVWLFNDLVDAKSHFEWLRTINVVYIDDKRIDWRDNSRRAELLGGSLKGYVLFWIEPRIF